MVCEQDHHYTTNGLGTCFLMNPFNSPSDLIKRCEPYEIIVDSSSEDDIHEEEIIDNSSPECPKKKSLINPHIIGCTSDGKSSVKRNIINHKPKLDIFIKSSKSNKSGRSPCGIKRKLPLSFELNSNVDGSHDDNENKVKSFRSSGYAISLQKEFVRVKEEIDVLCKRKKSSSKLFSSTVTKAQNEFPSPEIVSRKGSCQDGMKKKLPSANEINSHVHGSHDNIENKLRSFCTSGSAISLQEDSKDLSDEIIYSPDSSLNLSNEDIVCSPDATLNLSSKDIVCSPDATLNLSSKDIVCSPDATLNLSSEDIVCSPDATLNLSSEDIVCSPDATLNLSSEDIVCSPDATLNLSSEDIVCSPDATLNLSSEVIICSPDTSPNPSSKGPKDQCDFHGIEEEIIFSPDVSFNLWSEDNKISDKGKTVNVHNLHDNNIEDRYNMDLYLETSSNSLNKGDNEKQHKEGPTFIKSNEVQVYTPQNNLDNQSNVTTKSIGLQNKKMRKAPKKGTLLERAFRIMSNLKKEANLFSHEIKVGLRTSKGLLASEPVAVINILYTEIYYIVTCIPQEVSGTKSQTVEQKQEKNHLILLKIPPDIGVNSILVIHFPLVALVGLPSMTVILFAGNRIQTISANKFIEPACSIDKNISNCMFGHKDQKVLRVIKNRNSRDAIDYIVNQSLGNNCLLELRLLHLLKRTDNSTNIELLAVDSEKQFYLVKDSKFISLKDIHVEVDNSYMFLGFRIKNCCKVKDDVRSAAEYYSTLNFESDFIYILEPYIDSWEINFNRKIALNLLQCTQLSSGIKRFKQLVKEFKVSGNKILIRDESLSEMRELKFDYLCNEQKIKFITLLAPFILNGVYYIKGCLFYDKYSQITSV